MQRPNSDSDQRAWAIYEQFYGNQLDIEKRHLTFINMNTGIDVAGDVCFNVKLKPNTRYSLLGSVIKDEEEFDKLNALLENLIYSPMNISILPKTGGLNTIKGQFTCDRFDSFIWLLDAYYNGLRSPILNRGTKNSYIGNQNILDTFLSEIGSVHNFCKLFYGITNRNYINGLISLGKGAITKPFDYYTYLLNAILFWEYRLNAFNDKNILTTEEAEEYTSILNKLSETIRQAMAKVVNN